MADSLLAVTQWERMLEDPTLLRATFEAHTECRIPGELLDRIGQAIHHTPSRSALEEDITVALSKPFSLPEFKVCIGMAPVGAPGLTGLSYQMLKYLPDACIQHLFHMLHYLWRHDKHVPEYWKYKGLHGIPKPSAPVIRGSVDLRPIGL